MNADHLTPLREMTVLLAEDDTEARAPLAQTVHLAILFALAFLPKVSGFLLDLPPSKSLSVNYRRAARPSILCSPSMINACGPNTWARHMG
ncbi:hypothetical protein SAMN06295888_11570 [Desulfonatronum zhilinae]|nr:hypothetical protein SAMN06295888_11570 [Desulfonatronum zhilinae]